MDRTAKIWAVSLGKADPDIPSASIRGAGGIVSERPVHTFRGHFSDVSDATFLEADGRILTCDEVTARVFDSDSAGEARVLRTKSGLKGIHYALSTVAFAPGGRTVSAQPYTIPWSVDTGRRVSDVGNAEAIHVRAFGYSPDGQSIAEAENALVRVRPLAGGVGKSWPKTRYDVVGCGFVAGGKVATLGLDRGTLAIWDPETGKEVWSLRAHPGGAALALAISPDGQTLATCSRDRSVKLWVVADGRAIRTFTGHTHDVNHIAFSPDGTKLASASSDNTSRIWDLANGNSLTLHTRSHYVYGVAFSPDGKRLAEASGDGTVTIYDARTGQDALTLTGHVGSVKAVAFSPDGERLASAGQDGTVRLWHAPKNAVVDLPKWADDSFDPKR